MRAGYAFIGADAGTWRAQSTTVLRGDFALPHAQGLSIVPITDPAASIPSAWNLRAMMSNVRYATRPELTALQAIQQPLGRQEARCAALIPIRKSPAWWDLAQDERRAIFEDAAQHNAIGMQYLPAIARQLFHCRDLGEPFDFLTWFEFSPANTNRFDDLVGRLRESAEWHYVDRELDLRLESI
jgi:chlorite dismutase